MSDLTNISEAAIYVGTYAKYNAGSLRGDWLRLADYADKDEFYAACRELHKDESDPEFMFQDWENIPEGLCGESWVSARVWDVIALDDDDIELLIHYCDAVSTGIDDGADMDKIDIDDLLSDAKEAFVGYYESEEDLGIAEAEGLGIPKNIEPYFDYAAYGRDCAYDYNVSDGYYFDTNRL